MEKSILVIVPNTPDRNPCFGVFVYNSFLFILSQAFSHSFTVRAFIERVRGAGFDQNLEAVMTHVAKLFALDKMLTFAGDFRKVMVIIF